MKELLGVDDASYRLNEVVGDVERDGDDGASVRVEDQGPGLSVDLDVPDGTRAKTRQPICSAEQQPGNSLPPVDGARERGSPAAPVAVGDNVRGEQTNETLRVRIALTPWVNMSA